MVETVWAVRHGQRADSVADDWAEWADRVHDPHLTDHGRWEAWRVGRRLAATGVRPRLSQSGSSDAFDGAEFDAIYASPFLRCVETAAEVCAELDATFALEPGLGEHRNDDWFDDHPELLAPGELCERFDACTGVAEPVVHPEFPESHDEAERRVAEATRGLVECHEGTENERDGDHLLLIGHGLTIGGVVRGLVGSTEFVEAPLCGLTRVERRYADEDGDGSGDWHLCVSGDTLHLCGED